MIARRRRCFLPDADPDFKQGETTFLGDLFRSETVGGSVALVAALVALTWANLDYSSYEQFRGWQIGPLGVEQWASDGALTVFFFVAGLELKRELLVGSLRRPADAAVPVSAACCGVAVPALIFVFRQPRDRQPGRLGGAGRDRHRVRAGRPRRGRLGTPSSCVGSCSPWPWSTTSS